MEKDLCEIRNLVMRLETENSELVCENQDLMQEICNLKEQLFDSQRMNKEIREDLKDSHCQREKLEHHIITLEENLEEKDAEILELQKLFEDNEKLNCYLNKFKKDVEAVEKEKSHLEDNYRDLKICLQEKEALIRRLEIEIKDLHEEIRDLKNTNEQLCEQNENIKQELSDCHECLEKSTAEVTSLCKQLKQKESKKKQCFQDHSDKLRLCIQQTEEALHEERRNNKNMKAELDYVQENNRILKMENIRLDDEIYALKKTINSCNKNWEKTQQELFNVQREFKCYKESIGALKDQVSSNHYTRGGSYCDKLLPQKHCRSNSTYDQDRGIHPQKHRKKCPPILPSPPPGLRTSSQRRKSKM